MGRESPLTVTSGTSSLTMDGRLPLIIRGTLTEASTAIEKPVDQLLSTTAITLANPSFESSGYTLNTIPGWNLMPGGSAQTTCLSVNVDTAEYTDGSKSLRYDTISSAYTTWYGVSQTLTAGTGATIAPPGEDEYLVFKVTGKVKGLHISGTGLGCTLNFRDSSNAVLLFLDSSYYGYNDTFGWKDFTMTRRLPYWPTDTNKVTLEFLFAYAIGHVWLDDVGMTVERWKSAR